MSMGNKQWESWGKEAFPSRLGIAHKQLLIQSNKYFNPFLLSVMDVVLEYYWQMRFETIEHDIIMPFMCFETIEHDKIMP